ncbi:MAG TPA: archaellin/type IV pilin N-terminal domain-containing protein [Dehalococcoidales bacterium]|nr:archaellin/type IV pilin N-terminal domain-containing protein [Dehalococcoidales bacterium]
MLKKFFKQKRYFRSIYKSQKGITGLETAIILIAFVVVAAVFAYTVLSAGLFSTQKSQEAVYHGLKETQGTLQMLGGVVAFKDTLNTGGGNTGSIGRVDFTISLATDGTSVDLTPAFAYNPAAGGSLSCPNPGANRLQIAFNDNEITISDMAWTVAFIGKNNGDNMLDPGEKAVISVWLHSITAGTWSNALAGFEEFFIGHDYVDTYHTFTLEVKPVTGATLTIQRTTPAYLDTVIDLH